MDKKSVYFVFLRYLILIILGVPNLYLFYAVFTPLTIKPTFMFLSWVDPMSYLVAGTTNVIFFKGYFASIIPACVAGAAYYLLLILNLTTPMDSVKKRIGSITFILGAFLLLNLLRIFIFAMLLAKGYQYFDLTHTATWYFGSTVLVVLIWFSNVLIFRIKSIPIYSDLKQIYSDIKGQKPTQIKKTNFEIKPRPKYTDSPSK